MSSVAGINGNANTVSYTDYETNQTKTDSSMSKTEKNDAAASEGAVYKKTPSENTQQATYSVNKMSPEKRAELVQQLKADQANRQNQLLDIVKKVISKQANTFAQTDDDLWKFLSKGNFTVDAETKAQAQADIAEDGYYGVSKTAQRIFDFASALAGDDVDKMKEMQESFKKGFKQAEDLWGGEGKLPKISYDTQDAVNQMFEDYYKSKQTITEETV